MHQHLQGGNLSKKLDHFEVGANQIVGLVVGYLITRFVSIELAGKFHPDILAICVTILFFILSYSRTYGFRRLFRYLEKKLENINTDKKDELS